MKKAFTVIAVTLIPFAFWGCSDDSSADNATEVVVEDLPDGNLVDGGGEQAEGQSGENLPVGNQDVAYTGFAEAGPFLVGGSVKMNAVDPATLKTLGESLETTVVSDRGDFAFTGTLESAYASLEASGRFFHYSNSDTVSSITLNAYTNLADHAHVNVNMLTHMEYARMNQLVAEEGMTFADAKKKAEKEIVAAFHLPEDTARFESVSLASTGTAAQNLLAVTSIVLGERSGDEISGMLTAITDDIARDGKWDDDSLKAFLADEAYFMSVGSLGNVLSTRLGIESVETFESAVMEFWSQEYGIGTCADSTDGVMRQNLNKYSSNNGRYFKCGERGWIVVSEIVIKSMELSKVFGECTNETAGTIKTDSSVNYICHQDIWRVATEAEMENKAKPRAPARRKTIRPSWSTNPPTTSAFPRRGKSSRRLRSTTARAAR